MTYVALLRGINVGGNHTVSMRQLAICFETLGLQKVKTYINSGNVIFETNDKNVDQLTESLEEAIEKNFGFTVKVLLGSLRTIQSVVEILPAHWINDQTMKCDVMFLWPSIDTPQIIEQLAIKPNIDQVKYLPGAIIWQVDRHNVTKSGMLQLVGTKLYKQMTIRNCNTVRKIYALMQAIQEE